MRFSTYREKSEIAQVSELAINAMPTAVNYATFPRYPRIAMGYAPPEAIATTYNY
ncbi:MAG: hypothetical protein V7K27_23960 [Nostoc sp.]|uniref:hypothetical protein n=1 Tax=Nostoc sp. TaxID=1180 RepID=UPI002FF7238F